MSWMNGSTKKPQSSVIATAAGRVLNTAESAKLLCSKTVAPFTGARVLQSCTVPVIIIESIFGPVEKA